MSDSAVRRLREACIAEPRLLLSVAESLTCGRVQAAIGAISGASDFFLGGITAYTAEQKVRHLGVDPVEAARTDSVSPVVAAQMAAGACRLFGSDFAAATTGYAEPNPERGFPDPTAFFAVARLTKAGAAVVREGTVRQPGASRGAMQEAVVATVLVALLEAILDARREIAFTPPFSSGA